MEEGKDRTPNKQCLNHAAEEVPRGLGRASATAVASAAASMATGAPSGYAATRLAQVELGTEPTSGEGYGKSSATGKQAAAHCGATSWGNTRARGCFAKTLLLLQSEPTVLRIDPVWMDDDHFLPMLDHGRPRSAKVDPCSSMVDQGRPWSTIVDHGRPVLEHGRPRSTMVDHGRPMSTMVDNGRPWLTMVVHGRPWSTVVDHGRPWPTMLDHGRPWSTVVDHGRPWSTIVDHGRPWSPKDPE